MLTPEKVFDNDFSPDTDEIVWFRLSDKDHTFIVCQSDILQALRFAEKEGMIPELPSVWWDTKLSGYKTEKKGNSFCNVIKIRAD